jgi:hypothetical protein
MATNNDAKVIGYFAYSSRGEVLCDGDACIVAGSDIDLKTYISEMVVGKGNDYMMKKTRFGEIMRGIDLGAAYAFDETAYNRFYLLANRERAELDLEDFSPIGKGTDFIRVAIHAPIPLEK